MKPSAWPVFAAYLVALAAMLAASEEVVVAVGRCRSNGDAARVASETSQFALSLPGLVTVAVVDALILSTVAWITARALAAGVRVTTQLALSAGRASPLGWIAGVTGVSGLSLACGDVVARVDGHHGVMRIVATSVASSGGGGLAAALVGLALLPGFAEEVFFRGWMQTRLAAAWGRWPAIVATSTGFGALHLDAAQGAAAFVVGLMLGWLAARFEGIGPAVAAHVANNALFVGLSFLGRSGDSSGQGPPVMLAVGIALTVGAIAVLRSRLSLRASTRAS